MTRMKQILRADSQNDGEKRIRIICAPVRPARDGAGQTVLLFEFRFCSLFEQYF